MKRFVSHKTNTYRNAVLWIFAISMMISGIHLGTISAAAISLRQEKTPLSAETYQVPENSLYHDISTSEITGAKNANTILHCAVRNRGRALYHNIYITQFMEKHTACSLLFKTTVQHTREAVTDSICTIIRYIHNQDGEKGGLTSTK